MIDFDKYASLILQFLSHNIFVAIGLGVAIIFFFYKKPEETIKFLGFCALLVTVIYVMSLLSESGSQGVYNKKGGIEKSELELSN